MKAQKLKCSFLAALGAELGTAVVLSEPQPQGYGLLKVVLECMVLMHYTENSQKHT